MALEEETCCGNGCNNCVLDRKSSAKNGDSKDNVFEHRYQWFTVTDIRRETSSVFVLEFQFPSLEEKCLHIPPGAHLMLRLPWDCVREDTNEVFADCESLNLNHTRNNRPSNDPDTKEDYVSRPYTPFNYSPDTLKFSILFRYEGGAMSQRLVKLKVGDSVEWKGFYGDFKYTRNMAKNLICISQGVAIATMTSVIHRILADEEDETRIHLISCFRDFPDILLKHTLRDFLNYWNFKLSLYLPYHSHSAEANSSCKCKETRKLYNEEIYFEKIQGESLKSGSEALYLISGSVEFSSNISNLLQTQLCIDPSNIFAF